MEKNTRKFSMGKEMGIQINPTSGIRTGKHNWGRRQEMGPDTPGLVVLANRLPDIGLLESNSVQTPNHLAELINPQLHSPTASTYTIIRNHGQFFWWHRHRRDLMWLSLRYRTLSLSYEAIHQWNCSFCLSVSNTKNTNGKSGNVVESLNLKEVEKILRDVRADDVRVIPVRKQSKFTNFVVVATCRSQWHVRNIVLALIYKACSTPLVFIYTVFSSFLMEGKEKKRK